MIKFEKVTKTYAQKKVLDEIDLTLKENQVHVFIGSSGSGKTTLLKLLAGLISAEEGTVECLGRESQDFKKNSYLSSIGYVIQEGGLFPHLTARENVLLALKNLNVNQDEANSRINYLLTLVHLQKDQLDKFPHQLSGGQRQRIGLMRALIRQPKLLLMDEPLGALDPLVRADLQKELLPIFKRLNITVIFVTHDLNEAAAFGDSITLIHEGRIVQHGSLQDLIHRPAQPFVTEFINAQKSEPLMREMSK